MRAPRVTSAAPLAVEVKEIRGNQTRKMVNFCWTGRSQKKFWWKFEGVITCKFIPRSWQKGRKIHRTV